MFKNAFFLLSLFLVASCSNTPGTNSSPPILGWFDGLCFASHSTQIESGTRLSVITVDEPQKVYSAIIVGPADIRNCGPLAKERREINEAGGLHFYNVTSTDTINLAIGLIADNLKFITINSHVLSDINNDGKLNRFTHCATSEGISFDIWNSKPYKEKPLWSGYYYLGYDVERNCP